MPRSILDFHPVNDDVVARSGAEPSLRELVFKYYDRYIQDEKKAVLYAREYCLQVESVLYAAPGHQQSEEG